MPSRYVTTYLLAYLLTGGADNDSNVDNRPGLQHRIHDTVRGHPAERPVYGLLRVA